MGASKKEGYASPPIDIYWRPFYSIEMPASLLVLDKGCALPTVLDGNGAEGVIIGVVEPEGRSGTLRLLLKLNEEEIASDESQDKDKDEGKPEIHFFSSR